MYPASRDYILAVKAGERKGYRSHASSYRENVASARRVHLLWLSVLFRLQRYKGIKCLLRKLEELIFSSFLVLGLKCWAEWVFLSSENSFILTKETSVERYMVGTYWSEKKTEIKLWLKEVTKCCKNNKRRVVQNICSKVMASAKKRMDSRNAWNKWALHHKIQ